VLVLFHITTINIKCHKGFYYPHLLNNYSFNFLNFSGLTFCILDVSWNVFASISQAFIFTLLEIFFLKMWTFFNNHSNVRLSLLFFACFIYLEMFLLTLAMHVFIPWLKSYFFSLFHDQFNICLIYVFHPSFCFLNAEILGVWSCWPNIYCYVCARIRTGLAVGRY